MAQSISFFGAAETVTGSRHLLNLDGKLILVDCGLFQGSKELSARNWQPFPVEIDQIDAIVITHAHQDHIGYLPRLVAQGYKGPIYATPATIGLCKISLPDSGRIQEEDARYHNKHKTSSHDPAEPLFTESDAYEALKYLRPLHYFQYQGLPGKSTFRFIPAGHIVGSAFAEVYFENGERILMGGDLGRYNTPIITDPTPIEFAEYLVIESTYGDRLHGEGNPKEVLERILNRAYETNGIILTPSFAIGRTQEMLWYLNELAIEGRLPNIPIYVDSPMANAATLLYQDSDEDHDRDMKVRMDEGASPFRSDLVKFIRDKNMSKQLNKARGPWMLIAGSGMCNGGRIVHHLQAHIEDPNTTILFTGYQANGTLGRHILDGNPEVSIFGQRLPVRATVERLDMLSAHADYAEILTWLRGFKSPPKMTFIVHGEPPAQASLQEKIERELGWKTTIPFWGQTIELT